GGGDEEVAGRPRAAVAEGDLAHPAAGGVLPLLDVGLAHDEARGNDSARNSRGRGPTATPAEGNNRNGAPCEIELPDRGSRTALFHGHRAAPVPAAPTIFRFALVEPAADSGTLLGKMIS